MRIRKIHWALWLLLGMLYLTALFMPLMENDSAQFAVMAMNMAQENDYWHLYKNGVDYLDKPHMHYWLSALSFELFGYTPWAYRLPAFLSLMLGAYSLFRLGDLVKNKSYGSIAAFVFLSTQAMLLAAFDLRTDTVLVSFVAFSLWKLLAYAHAQRLADIAIAAFAAAIAFSTKGMLAVVVIGFAFLSYIYLQKSWRVLWSYKIVLGLLVFFLSLSPVLYAYYLQFDLHPEKVIRGVSERSGVRFILWDQSFERLSGTGHGKNSNGFFFFFHTVLWVLLPYTFYFVAQGFRFSINALSVRLKPIWFAFLALIPLFLLMSLSQFKLPHYLNVLMPLFALVIAHGVQAVPVGFWRKLIAFSSFLLVGVYFLASVAVLLVFYPNLFTALFFFGSWILIGYLQLSKRISHFYLMLSSAFLFNLLGFFHFYPNLLEYQSGAVLHKRIPTNAILYNYSDDYVWALDFNRKKSSVPLSQNELKALPKASYVYVDQAHLTEFKRAHPSAVEQASASHYRVTRLNFRFLNRSTRSQELTVKRILYVP